jgi:hypothetical protein
MPPVCDLSTRLRKYLAWAGVTRAELFADDRTRKQITFYDLRATGITWMAIRGDGHLRIQSRAGHSDFRTTQGYIREAESLEGAVRPDEVFPELPPELLAARIIGGGQGFAQLGGLATAVSSGVRVAKHADSEVESSGVCADVPVLLPLRIPLGTLQEPAQTQGVPQSGPRSAKNPAENAPADLRGVVDGMAALLWLDGELDAFLAAGGDEGAELAATLRRARADAAERGPTTKRSAEGGR